VINAIKFSIEEIEASDQYFDHTGSLRNSPPIIMGGVLMFRSERMRRTGARSSASETSSPMQSWADYITGTHESNFWKRQAPGVGKSFIARRLAYALMGYRDPSRVRTVQFHQSYSYEDFVQGYRPDGQRGFELKSGVF